MHIAVKRSGGFAGLDEAAEVDTDKVDSSSTLQLQELVRQARLIDRPAAGVDAPIGADMLRCTITVTDGGWQRTITFVEEGRPETAILTQLIDAVLQIGRA
jgi:hypothetical protein